MSIPELYCQIQRYNGDIAHHKEIHKMIDMSVIILLFTIMPIIIYDTTVSTGNMFLLTPGQQWLEITMMICVIVILLLLKLITYEFTERIVKKIELLNEQNEANVNTILKLENEMQLLQK